MASAGLYVTFWEGDEEEYQEHLLTAKSLSGTTPPSSFVRLRQTRHDGSEGVVEMMTSGARHASPEVDKECVFSQKERKHKGLGNRIPWGC